MRRSSSSSRWTLRQTRQGRWGRHGRCRCERCGREMELDVLGFSLWTQLMHAGAWSAGGSAGALRQHGQEQQRSDPSTFIHVAYSLVGNIPACARVPSMREVPGVPSGEAALRSMLSHRHPPLPALPYRHPPSQLLPRRHPPLPLLPHRHSSLPLLPHHHLSLPPLPCRYPLPSLLPHTCRMR